MKWVVAIALVAASIACSSKEKSVEQFLEGMNKPVGGISRGPSKVKSTAVSQPDGLALLNRISGTLRVELDRAPVKINAALENVKAPSGARLLGVKLAANIYVAETEDFRELTAAEFDTVVFRGRSLVLRGLAEPIEHIETDESFTVRDVLRAVEATELSTRGHSEWFDGIDVHHIFFEGLHEEEAGVWTIYWGS